MKNNFLADVDWTLIGSTDEFSELKKAIGHVCNDVTQACCIDEICIMDILTTFRKHGYEVLKKDDYEIRRKKTV